MANQLKKKFIGNDQVGADKVLIESTKALRAMDGATEVDLIKVSSSEVFVKGFKLLESSGLIDSARLPSYVDDVLEYANLAAFPASGEAGKIYVALDTNKTYRWSGSAYVQITSGAVDSVNGETGLVVLDAGDINMVSAPGTTVESKLVSLQNEVDAVEGDVANLVTLSGVAVDSTSLGSFTGNTIPDSQTIKQALQALETAHEAHLNDATDAHAATAISFSGAASGLAATTVQAAIEEVEGRVQTLETALKPTWARVKFDLTATNISNGYVDLAHNAIGESIHAFVDRLAIHQGEDFTISVVSGVTRITFAGDLVSPGQSQLDANDNIYVRYQYLA